MIEILKNKNSIEVKQKKLIEKFAGFLSWEEKYKYIISLGKDLQGLSENEKTEKNLIKGCQSQTWMTARVEDNGIVYFADSDAMIVKGLAAILISVFSRSSPDEILAAKWDFLTETGLTTHLSQSRANGLTAMVKQLKNYAVAFQVMMKQ